MSDETEFAKSAPALRQLFGTRALLQEQKARETEAIVGVVPIMIWVEAKAMELAKQAGGKALEWGSSKLLEAIGIGGGTDELKEIKEILNKVSDTQQKILERVNELLTEMQFENLITRSFNAVERIVSRYGRLLNLAGAPEDERAHEVAALKNGILDANSGALVDLETLHDILVGNSRLDLGGKALLNMFMERWKKAYTEKQLSPEVPLIDYHDKSYEYLHSLFLLQYMGLSQLANARSANGDYTLLRIEVDKVLQNMKKQQEMVDRWIPPWTLEWPMKFINADEPWHVIRAKDTRGHRGPQVLYGSPATGFTPLDYSVQFRERNPNNKDEEWRFIWATRSDTFHLRKRPGHYTVAERNGNMRMSTNEGWETFFDLRFVMSPKGQPVIAAINRKPGYINWRSGEGLNGICFIGGIEGAVEVDVEPCDH